jgi:hypothetical protein
MQQLEKLKAALADFRGAQAELHRVMREAPKGAAGRTQFEAALAAAVEAGDRMEKAAIDSNAITLLAAQN